MVSETSETNRDHKIVSEISETDLESSQMVSEISETILFTN